MMLDVLLGRSRVDIVCDVDIEQTPESLHAYAVPDGIDINPGDVVIVHGAPTKIGFGEKVAMQCRATVIRAGWFDRLATEWGGLFQLTELYHVGFEPHEPELIEAPR